MRQFITVILILMASTAYGAKPVDRAPVFFGGKSLLDLCKDKDLWLACSGYIAGVSDTHSLYYLSTQQGNRPKRLCIPKSQDASMEKLKEILSEYLEETPDQQAQPGTVAVINALRKAFPCK